MYYHCFIAHLVFLLLYVSCSYSARYMYYYVVLYVFMCVCVHLNEDYLLIRPTTRNDGGNIRRRYCRIDPSPRLQYGRRRRSRLMPNSRPNAPLGNNESAVTEQNDRVRRLPLRKLSRAVRRRTFAPSMFLPRTLSPVTTS